MPIPVRLTALRMRELSAPSSPDSHTSSPTKEKQNWENQPFQHPFSPVPSTTYFHPVDKKPVCSACVWEKWGSVKTKRAPSAIPSWMVWLDKYLIPSAQSHQEVLAVWERELGKEWSWEGVFYHYLTSGLPESYFHYFLLTSARSRCHLGKFHGKISC